MDWLHHPDTSAATRRIDEFRWLTPWVMITSVENHTARKVSSKDSRSTSCRSAQASACAGAMSVPDVFDRAPPGAVRRKSHCALALSHPPRVVPGSNVCQRGKHHQLLFVRHGSRGTNSRRGIASFDFR